MIKEIQLTSPETLKSLLDLLQLSDFIVVGSIQSKEKLLSFEENFFSKCNNLKYINFIDNNLEMIEKNTFTFDNDSNKLNEIKINKLELNLNDEWNKWFQNDKYEDRIENTYGKENKI